MGDHHMASHYQRRSPTAQSAARNWQRKVSEFAVSGVGFGLLGRGYDVKPHEKEVFFEKYMETQEIYEPSPYNHA